MSFGFLGETLWGGGVEQGFFALRKGRDMMERPEDMSPHQAIMLQCWLHSDCNYYSMIHILLSCVANHRISGRQFRESKKNATERIQLST